MMARHPYSYSHTRPSIDIQIPNGTHSHNGSTVPSAWYLSPPAREDSTRVQLQKQRLSEQHHAVVVSQKIPGLKTSVAFFASLRTNLHLTTSTPPSPISTPPCLTASTWSLPPPSPLSVPVAMDQVIAPSPGDPLAGVPELRSYLTRDEREKTEALKLVSDGVAQMRPIADKALIFHPLNLIVLAGILALIYWFMVDSRLDRVSIGAAGTFLLVVALAGVRLLTQGYLWNAEDIDRDWLGSADVIVTKFGNDLIGAVVLDWVSGESRQKRKRAWRGEIRAWTVHKRYRNKGVGASLLEEAVRESRRKGAESIAFADDHANSERVLPSLYNSSFDVRESRARDLLWDLQEVSPRGHRRRRGGSNGSRGSNGGSR